MKNACIGLLIHLYPPEAQCINPQIPERTKASPKNYQGIRHTVKILVQVILQGDSLSVSNMEIKTEDSKCHIWKGCIQK